MAIFRDSMVRRYPPIQRPRTAKVQSLLVCEGGGDEGLEERVWRVGFGLGYVTQCAAKRAVRVTTVEVDPAVCDLHHASPWSAPLYTSPNITVVNESCLTFVASQPSGSYDVIFHDPPTVQIAGDLYSKTFYAELLRLLSRKGVLFHYIGSPESRNGSTMMRGTKRN